jgi:hypothetical protein
MPFILYELLLFGLVLISTFDNKNGLQSYKRLYMCCQYITNIDLFTPNIQNMTIRTLQDYEPFWLCFSVKPHKQLTSKNIYLFAKYIKIYLCGRHIYIYIYIYRIMIK